MKILNTALALIALALPASAFAAGSGDLGTSSFATSDISLNVVPPTGTLVQILGLDNYAFGDIITTNNTVTTLPAIQGFLCLNRSDAGLVRVTVTQAGVAAGQNLRLNGAVQPIMLSVTLSSPTGANNAFAANSQADVPQSGAGCTASTVSSIAHRLTIAPQNLPGFATTALTGTYTGTITVTASVP